MTQISNYKLRLGRTKPVASKKIWFRDTHDFSFWHACQVRNLMWVGLKRIGHIANTTHLIPLGEACAMILLIRDSHDKSLRYKDVRLKTVGCSHLYQK